MRYFYRFMLFCCEFEREITANPTEKAWLTREIDRWECELMRVELGL